MSKRPLVPVLIAFGAALSAAPRLVGVPTTAVLAGAGLCLAGAAISYRQRGRRATEVCLLLCVACLGLLRARLAASLSPDDIARAERGVPIEGEGYLTESLETHLRTCHAVVSMSHLRVEGQRRRECRGRLLLVTDRSLGWRVGEAVRFRSEGLRSIRPATNPGEFSEAHHRERQGIRVRAFAAGESLQRLRVPPHFLLKRRAESARRWIAETVRRHMPGPYATLCAELECSILYGMHAAPIAENIEDSFRRSGTIHLLVVSGTQVAFLVIFLMALCGFFPRQTTLVLLPPVLLFYVLLTLEPPSIVRAGILGILVIAARALDRDLEPLNALALCGLVILSVRPGDLHDLGLQLSFAACFGIIRLTPSLRRLFRFLPKRLALVPAATCAAQFGVAPLLAYHFGTVIVVGPVSNLIAIPSAGVLLGVGIGTCLLSGICGPAAGLLGQVAHALVLLLLRNAQLFANVPFSTVGVPPRNEWWLLAGLAAIAIVPAASTERLRAWLAPQRLCTAALLLVTACAAGLTWRHCRPRVLQVTVLDVGQGDAIVVHAAHGKSILIDGGSHDEDFLDVGRRVILPYLAERCVRSLDAVILTHPHTDHVNGLVSVLQEVPVGMILDARRSDTCPEYEQLRLLAHRREVPCLRVERGQRLDLGGGAELFVLWPPQELIDGTADDANNNSVVTKLCYGEVSFLLTGDLCAEGERALLPYGDDLRSTVLKVGHHGAREASTQAFLARVRPAACALSVGRRNRFGHPSSETLGRLRETGAELYRTDVDGALTFETDGRRLWVNAFVPRQRSEVHVGSTLSRPSVGRQTQ